jgi:hypothetical protein
MKATLKLEDGREISVEVTEDEVVKMKEKKTGFQKGDRVFILQTD